MVKDALQQKITDANREGWGHWIKSEADEHAVLNGCWFDEDYAHQFVNFFECALVHTRGKLKDKPFKLLDWQYNDLIMPLFGWKDKDGLRRYRKAGVWIPKKQGKSTLAGALVNAVMHLSGDRAECYGFAHTIKQSEIVFSEAAAFAQQSEILNPLCKVVESRKKITVKSTGSFYQAREGENGAKAAEGINPVLIVFDELHVQRDRKLFDALTYACAAQEESLNISISTVGINDPTTIWWEQYDYGKRIIAGDIYDDSYFALVAQADEDCLKKPELLFDPIQQKKANLSLDEPGCPTTKELNIAVQEAINSPSKKGSLFRYRFNIPTSDDDALFSIDSWNELAAPLPDLEGRRCYGGLDLSSKEDLTAWALYFPPDEDDELGRLLVKLWAPSEKMLERSKKGLEHYAVWRRDGHLTVTDGSSIKESTILKTIQDDLEKYDIREIGYDIWCMQWIRDQLEAEHGDDLMVKVNQNDYYHSCNAMIVNIDQQKFRHDGNKCNAWCVSNVVPKLGDNDEPIAFSKKKSPNKIDGAVATCLAMGRADAADEDTASIYDEPGGLFL